MNRSLRMSVALLLASGVAHAGPPNASTSSVPPGLTIVAMNVLEPDPNGRFEIIVRDDSGTPLPGVEVALELGDCQDLRLCTNTGPGAVVDCTGRRVVAPTDPDGRVVFFVVGSMSASLMERGAHDLVPRCVRVVAGGIELARVPAAVLDLSPAGVGLFSPDLSVWSNRYGVGYYYQACDFGFDGAVGVADFSIVLQRLGEGWSNSGCASGLCP